MSAQAFFLIAPPPHSKARVFQGIALFLVQKLKEFLQKSIGESKNVMCLIFLEKRMA